MSKLFKASFILVCFLFLSGHVFAVDLNCEFKENPVEGIESIQVSGESMLINQEVEIPLDKTRVKCGNFGRQIRYDGRALGYQVILESCSTEAKFEGRLIDSINQVAGKVLCHQTEP